MLMVALASAPSTESLTELQGDERGLVLPLSDLVILEPLEETEIAVARTADPVAPENTGEAKNKPKRKPLPKDLPRNETVLTPGETCADCGGRLKPLGEDVTEELEYIPGRFVVNRFVRPRQ